MSCTLCEYRLQGCGIWPAEALSEVKSLKLDTTTPQLLNVLQQDTFSLINEERAEKLYVCKFSHQFAFYPVEAACALTEVRRQEPIRLPSYAMIVGHGWLQHANAENLGHHDMRNYQHLAPQGVSLNEDVYFSYGWNLKLVKKKRLNLYRFLETPKMLYRWWRLRTSSKYVS